MRFIKNIFGKIGKRLAQRKQEIFPAVSVFDQPFYAEFTKAELVHLESLNLPVRGKTVVDIGCGIGRLSDFFVKQDCDVLCMDGRPENIQKLRTYYPSRKAVVVDVETPQILEYGKFDVVFCYGLLYHLMDSFGFIKNAYKMCKEMIILETCITDAHETMVRLVQEGAKDVSQSIYALGSR